MRKEAFVPNIILDSKNTSRNGRCIFARHYTGRN